MPYRVRLAGISLAAVIALVVPAAAQADSASISVTGTDGRSDPAADVARTFTVSGNTASPRNLYVSYRPAGGAACAPSASTDTGRDFWYGDDVNGDFSISR